MRTKYDDLVDTRDTLARATAQALLDGNKKAALRLAAKYGTAEADVHRYLEDVTR